MKQAAKAKTTINSIAYHISNIKKNKKMPLQALEVELHSSSFMHLFFGLCEFYP